MRGVGCAGDPQALNWFVTQLDEVELEAVALQEIARLAPRATGDLSSRVAAKLRPYLQSKDPSLRAHAARAVAGLGDTRAIPGLVMRLEASKGSERKTVHSALMRISDRELPADVAVWKAWYTTESSWWKSRSPKVLESLASTDDSEVLSAIRELSMHTLHRDLWAIEMARGPMRHASDSVRRQACLALASSRSSVALDELRRAVEEGDPALREHARAALLAIETP
jgi:HEAT repeat protein